VSESANFIDDPAKRTVWLASQAPRDAEREEEHALDRARYLLRESPSFIDPRAELDCIGGPYALAAPGSFRPCGCPEWPNAFRPQEAPDGEYVLAYVWREGDEDGP
jgi:hypothetical protein